jgi:choice-of-anchor A domain-containing protein
MVSHRFMLLACIMVAVASANFHPTNCPLLSFMEETPNVVIFGDFSSPSADTEGALYVGGDVTLKGYSVGAALRDEQNADALIVGGDLNFATGTVFGHVKCGTSCGVAKTVHTYGYSTLPNRFNFTAAAIYYQGLSKDLAVQEGVDSFGGTLNAKNQRYSYFFMDCENLNRIKSLSIINVPEDGLAVLNFRGTECVWDTLGVTVGFEQNSNNIVFNFPQAEKLRVGKAVIPGSVLAPYANIEGNAGVINGIVVGASFTGITQLNYFPVNRCFDNNELVVPVDLPEIDVDAIVGEAGGEGETADVDESAVDMF